jgi:acetylornithine/N-succinyldiaminopimelate aminotransferase
VKSSLMDTYQRWHLELVSGEGAKVRDPEGRAYVDMVGGIAVTAVGHCHPRVTQAIADQAARLVHVSNLYWTRPQQELADRLSGLTGGMSSFFGNSGAEAIECAIKLARKWGRVERGIESPTIIAMDGGFHGRTLGALAATGQPGKQDAFRPMPEGFTHVPFGDARALEETFHDGVIAVLLEPIQGEAGVVIPPDGYLRRARALCDEHDALLILDEIQTGMGRTGMWFASQYEDVTADLMCLAKAIGGGLPMGVCLARETVAGTFAPGDHASTFGGGPVQSAAALAVIDVIEEEGLLERARKAGERLARGLSEIFGDGVRGRGLLVAVEVGEDRARSVCERALEMGLLVNDVTKSVIRLAPPLVIEDQEIDDALGVLAEVADG